MSTHVPTTLSHAEIDLTVKEAALWHASLRAGLHEGLVAPANNNQAVQDRLRPGRSL
jgi:hypothetical protein